MPDPSPSSIARLGTLGAVAFVNSHSVERQRLPIGALRLWIEPAIELAQCHVFYDAQERPSGYMTWAFLSVAVAKRVAQDAATVLHPSEWNEGKLLWLMDLVALNERVPAQAKALLRTWSGEFGSVSFVRSDRSMRRVKRFKLLDVARR